MLCRAPARSAWSQACARWLASVQVTSEGFVSAESSLSRLGQRCLTRTRVVAPGLSEAAMDRHPKLREFFKVTALATDRDGGVYVANLEARDYPITATQWHPVRRWLRRTCV